MKVNGNKIEYHADMIENSWSYNGKELSTNILIPEYSVHEKKSIEIERYF